MNHKNVQQIAKDTISYIKTVIEPDMNLRELRKLCEDKMISLGADSFWYYDIGAFVFSGDETAVSVSGKEYVTSDRKISADDIITIDLSPQKNHIWGDYSRTIVIENGQVINEIGHIKNEEWRNGLSMEEMLHKELIDFTTENTTFEMLYQHINHVITSNGYCNLDFLGNLGHSIVRDKKDSIYIEKGNQALLSSVDYFTFEPHISTPGSRYGYKKENIYFFSSGNLAVL